MATFNRQILKDIQYLFTGKVFIYKDHIFLYEGHYTSIPEQLYGYTVYRIRNGKEGLIIDL